jgi:hypothetical protein
MNDVILNKRTTILDKEALIDARRSLSVMLYDYSAHHKPKLTEADRRKLVSGSGMRMISEEYEKVCVAALHQYNLPEKWI